MTCENAEKVEHLLSCRKCRVDGLVCANFDVEALVLVCPARLRREKEKMKIG